jgi:hypothetical protein
LLKVLTSHLCQFKKKVLTEILAAADICKPDFLLKAEDEGAEARVVYAGIT